MAILYAGLNAGFLAVVQVVVYIGAIAILFIFAVMLTRRDMRDQGPQHNRGWWLAAAVSTLTLRALVWILGGWPGGSRVAEAMPADFDAVGLLGEALISPDAFVLPFEVASVLLVTALIGAVYAAFTRPSGEGMIPLSWYLFLAAALFSIGLFGVLSRRNAIAILLGVETHAERRQHQSGGFLALR